MNYQRLPEPFKPTTEQDTVVFPVITGATAYWEVIAIEFVDSCAFGPFELEDSCDGDD